MTNRIWIIEKKLGNKFYAVGKVYDSRDTARYFRNKFYPRNVRDYRIRQYQPSQV